MMGERMSIGTVDIPHVGYERFVAMWQKSRSVWAYIHEHYVDDYDFFWLGGDDFYLIVENLINYLATLHKPGEPEQALLLSHQIKYSNVVFCGGGAGYVLSKMALKRFVAEALSECQVRCDTTIIISRLAISFFIFVF